VTELVDLTAQELLVLYERGETSPVDATDACLAQIERVDGDLHAVLTLCDTRARENARESEKRWRSGNPRKLEGIPYGLKDIIETQGIRTTGGSRLYADYVPAANATVAGRLEAAGGVLLAKLNTFEFAFGEQGAFEPARNPWDLTRTPGGSSSGSAAALAARELPVAIGTDTGGSIRVPAAFCGITGFKPTYGVVPRTGVMPLSWSLDHIGPMARSAFDAALILAVIAGSDDLDPATTAMPPCAGDNDLSVTDVKGLRVGFPVDWFFDVCDSDVRLAMEAALSVFEQGGAKIIDLRLPHAHLSDQRGIGWSIIYPECAAAHRDNLDRLDEYGPNFRQLLTNAQFVQAAEYVHALRVRERIQADFQTAFESIDVVLTPATVAVPPPLDDLTATIGSETYPWLEVIARATTIFNLTGMPALAIPAGLSREGLPIGMQIAAAPLADYLCLRAGVWFQAQTSHHRLVPTGAHLPSIAGLSR